MCVDGQLQCDSSAGTDDTTCNGFDDDCDGRVDENAPPGAACDQGGSVCGGQQRCVSGSYQCVGGEPIREESCDCSDNDCDTRVDEDPNCPSGATCANCECAFPCADGEFPCSAGKQCVDNFCVTDPCFGVNCPATPEGNKQICQAGACVEACGVTNCPAPLICLGTTGECAPDDCSTFPDRCATNEVCVAGACVGNACAGVVCGSGEQCSEGTCIASCAGVVCPRNQHCEKGTCVADPCGTACSPGQVCRLPQGVCGNNPCEGIPCQVGQWCDPQVGRCAVDPCNGIVCGSGQVCQNGSCYLPSDLVGEHQYVTAGGGGCASGSSGGGGALILLSCAMLWLAAPKRKRQSESESASESASGSETGSESESGSASGGAA